MGHSQMVNSYSCRRNEIQIKYDITAVLNLDTLRLPKNTQCITCISPSRNEGEFRNSDHFTNPELATPFHTRLQPPSISHFVHKPEKCLIFTLVQDGELSTRTYGRNRDDHPINRLTPSQDLHGLSQSPL